MAPVLGYRTTATQAVRGVDLTGKTAVITGTMHACASAFVGLVKTLVYDVSCILLWNTCVMHVRRKFWPRSRDSASSGTRRCQSDSHEP